MVRSRATAGLFVTGTDTDVGKTFVTCWIARQMRAAGLKIGAYKPACSGCQTASTGEKVWLDVQYLRSATGDVFEESLICPQRFAAPLAPPAAAALEGRQVDEQLLASGLDAWKGRVDYLLIEGVGGLLCPLGETLTVLDLVATSGYPLLIVSRMSLGTINHTLLTIEVARARGIPIAGVLMNQSTAAEDISPDNRNPELIARYGRVPVLGVLPQDAHGGLRQGAAATTINWPNLFAEARMSGPQG